MLITTRQIADALGVEEGTVREWRTRRWRILHETGPAFPDEIRGYEASEVAEFVKALGYEPPAEWAGHERKHRQGT